MMDQKQEEQEQKGIANTNNNDGPIGFYVGKSKYKVTKYLNQGAFGRLYLGLHVERKIEVAIKMEPINCDKPQLHLEYGFYKKLTMSKGVPKIYTFGPCGIWNALVMELLGPNLDKMLERCGGRFSMRSVVQLTIQFLYLFKGIHDCGILYRDTKPANFLLGLPLTNKYWLVHVVDLGFCKEWREEDGSHIKYQENKPFTGTVRYMSINNNLGREQSRRDDLEALCYMLIYFYKGRLPWQGIVASTLPKRYVKVCQCKIETPIEKLCSNMPEEFERMLRNVRALKFEERPNYNGLIQLFTNLLSREYLLDKNDRQIYDWDNEHKIRSTYLKRSIVRSSLFSGKQQQIITSSQRTGSIPTESITTNEFDQQQRQRSIKPGEYSYAKRSYQKQ